MKVLYLTREYPPHVYGGAGVHLEYLVREMTRLAQVEVRCFGDQQPSPGNPRVTGFPDEEPRLADHPGKVRSALQALYTCLHFNTEPIDADVVHAHTWYAQWGGVLAKLAYGTPLVLTVHSLEPLRPWKREQLGAGYELSSWVERTALEAADAVIAVSGHDRDRLLELFRLERDRLRVIPNGIDTTIYRKVAAREVQARHGVDPLRPYVLFLGRLSRQKGIPHFLRAAALLPPEIQVVVCAASPDAAEVEREVAQRVAELRGQRGNVVWIRDMLSRPETVELYSGAAVFCCPSIYEPFGMINLEAMACEIPVVASAVGGIPEIVVDGETGLLVDYRRSSVAGGEPDDPERFARDLAAAIRRLVDDPARCRAMGRAGRERAARNFGWDRIAAAVHEVYRGVCASRAAKEAR